MKKKKQKTKPAAETREKSPPAGEETLPSEETEQPSVATRPPFPEEEKFVEEAETAHLADEPAQEDVPAEEKEPEAVQTEWTVTARERRTARREEKARQKEAHRAKKQAADELLHREHDISRRAAKRLSRQRKQAAWQLGTSSTKNPAVPPATPRKSSTSSAVRRGCRRTGRPV